MDLRLVGVGVGLVALAACGSASSPPAPAPPRAVSVSPTPTPSDTDQILAQYRAFWRALPAASRAPASRRRAILNDYTSAEYLSSILTNLASTTASGKRLYGVNKPRASVAAAGDRTASIRDCQDSSRAGVETLAGKRLNAGLARNPIRGRMVLEHQRWRLDAVDYLAGTC